MRNLGQAGLEKFSLHHLAQSMQAIDPIRDYCRYNTINDFLCKLHPKRANKLISTLCNRSASEYIYEMHFHDTKPGSSESYVGKYEKYSQELANRTISCLFQS